MATYWAAEVDLDRQKRQMKEHREHKHDVHHPTVATGGDEAKVGAEEAKLEGQDAGDITVQVRWVSLLGVRELINPVLTKERPQIATTWFQVSLAVQALDSKGSSQDSTYQAKGKYVFVGQVVDAVEAETVSGFCVRRRHSCQDSFLYTQRSSKGSLTYNRDDSKPSRRDLQYNVVVSRTAHQVHHGRSIIHS